MKDNNGDHPTSLLSIHFIYDWPERMNVGFLIWSRPKEGYVDSCGILVSFLNWRMWKGERNRNMALAPSATTTI